MKKNYLQKKKQLFEKLFLTWKVTNQFAESMTGKKNPSFYYMKEALKTKISIYADQFNFKDKIGDDDFKDKKYLYRIKFYIKVEKINFIQF